MIVIENLVKYYQDFKAVDNISLTINRGEVIGLLGPNGAGKSTTIRTICGYLSPTSGRVKVADTYIDEDPLLAKKKIGYLPESAPLYGDMMVYDYLVFIARIRELPLTEQKSRIKELIDLCSLNDVAYKNINALSKGYKQRVGLAHALMGDPQILILDEPTSGLDPNQIIEIRKLIKKIGETKTVILSSHILSEVEATCDRIIIINRGKIVADNPLEGLKSQLGNRKTIVIQFSNEIREQLDAFSENLKSNFAIEKIDEEKKQENILVTIRYAGDKDLRNEIFALLKNTDLQIINFNQKEESLEDVFRVLTQDKEQDNNDEINSRNESSDNEANKKEDEPK